MFRRHRRAKVLTASLALVALAAPSTFAALCALDIGPLHHSHSKAQSDPEGHHHGSDDGSNSSESHHGHHGDQEEQSDSCCQRLIGSSTELIAAKAYGLAIPTYTDFQAILPTDPVVGVRLSQTMDPGFFSQDSGPPYGRPPSPSLGRAPPVLVA